MRSDVILGKPACNICSGNSPMNLAQNLTWKLFFCLFHREFTCYICAVEPRFRDHGKSHQNINFASMFFINHIDFTLHFETWSLDINQQHAMPFHLVGPPKFLYNRGRIKGIQWNPSGKARNVSLKLQNLVHFHAPFFTNHVYFTPHDRPPVLKGHHLGWPL